MNIANQDWRNHRVGHITVIRLKHRQKGLRDPRWTCRCDCGKTRDIKFSHLQTGRVTTCGDPLRHKGWCTAASKFFKNR